MSVESALRELSAEVSWSIRAITPNRPIEAKWSRFKEHDPHKTQRHITDISGIARLFEIGEFLDNGTSYQGYTTEGLNFESYVTFAYPRDPDWHRAALDDISEIRHWFVNHQGGSGVDGISSRIFDYETKVVIEKNMDDPWDYYTIRLLVRADITFVD